MRLILILGCLVLVMVIAPSEGYKWPWATGTAEAKSESEEEVQTGLVTVKKPQGKPKSDQSKDKSEGKPADPNPAKPQDKVKPDSNDKEKSEYKHAVPEETKPADPNPAKPQDKVKPDSIDKENKKSEYKHAVPKETKPADPKSETKPADPKPATPPTKDVDSKISKDTEKIATASALALAAMAAAEKNSYGGLYQGKKPESVAKVQTSLVKQQPSQDKPKTDSKDKKPEPKPTDTNMITPVLKVDPKVPTDPKTVAVASAATLAAAATQKKPSRGFFWSKKPKDSSESDEEIPTGLVKQKPKTASNGKPTEQTTTPPAIKVDPKILKDPKALAAVAAGTTAVAAAQKKIDENNKKMSQMKKKIKLEDELNIKDRDASLSDLNLDVIRKARPKIRWTLAAYAFVNLILFVAQYAGSIITPPIGRVIYGLDFAMKKLARAPVNNFYAKYVTENADYGLRYLEKHEDVRGSLKVGKVLRITSHDGHMTPVKILRMSKEDQIDPKLLNFVDKSVWEQLQEVYGKI
ncbi:uncharacterized protein LOC129005361 [Macrosteles quadrilineatus]|uniref:uncharacterized protein LOC129005361 n=1 Tax=Macrosteles quadrilineatus TaxID=74068 RepID=UPI0023E2260F|nr:uncharacterized protein LOC129005361 [Macrosteles quadrilineatus]